MGILQLANVRKTLYYLTRNGVRSTWYAVLERLAQKREERRKGPYRYQPPDEAELEAQSKRSAEIYAWTKADFSIVVPLYRTAPQFLKELTDSVKAQSYPYWELILADATEDDSVRLALAGFCEFEEIEKTADRPKHPHTQAGKAAPGGVVRYVKLSENSGISGNTNAALDYVSNRYVGLLDHDDLLTPDALFCMAKHLQDAEKNGMTLQMLYSDEDKCNADASRFYEPHYKEDFNYDLLLSNNYICHFLVMKTELIKQLRFRPEFDGAQDYDLVLRAAASLNIPRDPGRERQIGHVAKVLYHWRCHASSTAENPKSKTYAYEAGRRALQEHVDEAGFRAEVIPLKHVGFYLVTYPDGVFQSRRDIGAVGYYIYRKGRIAGGRMDRDGTVFYESLPKNFSGYMHRAALTQDAEAVDIRSMVIREDIRNKVTKNVKNMTDMSHISDKETDSGEQEAAMNDVKRISIGLGEEIRKRGYRILLVPSARQ